MFTAPRFRSEYVPLGAIAVSVAVAMLVFGGTSGTRLRPVAAQSGGSCEDVNTCVIWGVEPLTANTLLYEINVCTRSTVIHGVVVPFPGRFMTAAASVSTPAIILGDVFGGTAVYPIPAGPPGAVVAGTTVAGATAFTEGFTAIGLSGLWAGTLQNTHTPVALLGAGIGSYSIPEGDLVFDHAPNAKWPLKAAVIIPPNQFSLVDVSRVNGSHHVPRPVGNFLEGLAYDGSGQLWGLSFGGVIYAVNPATGGLTFHMFLPNPAFINLTDLASTPCSGAPASLGDTGDAPDSTNHLGVGMTAYSGISAGFPTVFDAATGVPVGPIHWASGQDTTLGSGASDEQDADKLPDTDGMTNIDPSLNAADRDVGDDGVAFPIALPQCQMTQFQYSLQITAGGAVTRYANVWLDFNRNGQWGDQIQCVDPSTQQTVTVDEWSVQNQTVSLGPGVHGIMTPAFRSLDVDDDLWMRFSVAEALAPAADGRGVPPGYETGETEDYLLSNTSGTSYNP